MPTGPRRRISRLFMLACLAASAAAPAVRAEEDFYAGRSLSFYVGAEPSSALAMFGRLYGQFAAKHIPGNPALILRFMPGATTMVLTNHLYNLAPRDGTALGIIHERMGLLPLIDPKGVQYDPLQLNWIGAMNDQLSICFVWHGSSVRSIEDAKAREVLVGSVSAVGGSDTLFPRIFNELLGTRFKVISGYSGTQAVNLAIERGETEGRCGFSWTSLKADKPDWIRDGKIRVLMQMSMRKSPDLPQVPMLTEAVTDPARQAALDLFLSSSVMAHPIIAPPGVPADRIKILRDAFDATLRDPELLAQAALQRTDIEPMSGVAIEALLRRLYATPKEIVESTSAWLK